MKRLWRFLHTQISGAWLSLWARLQLLTAGGRWAAQLSSTTRRSLRWLLVDGLFASLGDAILNAYQSVYLLALGATRTEIGWVSALSNLMMPLAMLPGARLAARTREYKRAVIFPALLARLSLLGLIFLPFFPVSNPARLIQVGLGFIVARAFLVQLFNPAWTALLGQLVPVTSRGRYFSTRNILMGAASFFALLVVGPLIDWIGTPAGYQWAIGIALLMGLGAVFAFSHLEEPARPPTPRVPGAWRHFLRGLRGQGRFVAFCLIAGVWSFAQQIAGPFFIIFLVDEVQASAAMVGLTSAASSLAALPGQRIFGALNDRKGARWVQRLTGLAIPLVPALWGYIAQPWQAFPLQLLSGFMWAGYNLAAFNLLLELTPEVDRPSYVAFYQALVGLGMAGGAVLGGWLAQMHGYGTLFWVSAGGRLLAALLFAWVIAGTAPPKLPAVHAPRPRFKVRLNFDLRRLRPHRAKEEVTDVTDGD